MRLFYKVSIVCPYCLPGEPKQAVFLYISSYTDESKVPHRLAEHAPPGYGTRSSGLRNTFLRPGFAARIAQTQADGRPIHFSRFSHVLILSRLYRRTTGNIPFFASKRGIFRRFSVHPERQEGGLGNPKYGQKYHFRLSPSAVRRCRNFRPHHWNMWGTCHKASAGE